MINPQVLDDAKALKEVIKSINENLDRFSAIVQNMNQKISPPVQKKLFFDEDVEKCLKWIRENKTDRIAIYTALTDVLGKIVNPATLGTLAKKFKNAGFTKLRNRSLVGQDQTFWVMPDYLKNEVTNFSYENLPDDKFVGRTFGTSVVEKKIKTNLENAQNDDVYICKCKKCGQKYLRCLGKGDPMYCPNGCK